MGHFYSNQSDNKLEIIIKRELFEKFTHAFDSVLISFLFVALVHLVRKFVNHADHLSSNGNHFGNVHPKIFDGGKGVFDSI